MARYRLKDGAGGHRDADGERHTAGDVLEFDGEPVAAIADKFEAVGAEDDEAAADDAEICGAEMSGGDICERPADECPYHDPDGEED